MLIDSAALLSGFHFAGEGVVTVDSDSLANTAVESHTYHRRMALQNCIMIADITN